MVESAGLRQHVKSIDETLGRIERHLGGRGRVVGVPEDVVRDLRAYLRSEFEAGRFPVPPRLVEALEEVCPS